MKLTAKYSQHNYSLLRFYINVREEKELIWNGFFFFFVREKRNRKESFRNIKLILDSLSLILAMILGYITYILPYLGYFSNEKYHQRIFEELRDKKIFDPPLSEGDINLVNFIIEYNRTHINLKIILAFDSLGNKLSNWLII